MRSRALIETNLPADQSAFGGFIAEKGGDFFMREIIKSGVDNYPKIDKEMDRYLQLGDRIAGYYGDGRVVVGKIIGFGGRYSQTSSPYSTIEIESPPELLGRKYSVHPPNFISRVGEKV